jgi:hypothetical protein
MLAFKWRIKGRMMPFAVKIANEFLVTNRARAASIAGNFALFFC